MSDEFIKKELDEDKELFELAKKFGDNYTYGQIVKTLKQEFISKKRVIDVIEKLKYAMGGTSTTEVVNARILKKELDLEVDEVEGKE